MRICLVEDDHEQAAVFQTWLGGVGHRCVHYDNGREFIAQARHESFDLVILDWSLPDPDLDGARLLDWLRHYYHWPVPVMFLSVRGEEQDIVYALENGADDYVIKPVGKSELLARITALSRRTQQPGEPRTSLKFGRYAFDLENRQVICSGKPVPLTAREFDLAVFLFRNAGRTLSRSHILQSAWMQHPGLNTRTVDTYVSRLRRKLLLRPENGWVLQAVYQHGYRLQQLDNKGGMH